MSWKEAGKSSVQVLYSVLYTGSGDTSQIRSNLLSFHVPGQDRGSQKMDFSLLNSKVTHSTNLTRGQVQAQRHHKLRGHGGPGDSESLSLGDPQLPPVP